MSFFKLSFSEKVNFVSLIGMIGASSILYIPIAILFKDPIIFCHEKSKGIEDEFRCYEKTACSGQYDFRIDKINGPLSFSSEFELICDNSSLKRLALTCIFIGYFLGATIQMIFFIPKEKKKNVIVMGSSIFGISFIFMIIFEFFGLRFELIIPLFLICGLFFVSINPFAFVYATETIKGELAAYFMVFSDIAWGFYGILLSILGYFTNADWQIIIFFGAIIQILSTSFFLLSKSQSDTVENEEEEELNDNNTNILPYIKEIWSRRETRINFLFYTFLFSFYLVVYTVQYVEMESVGGNVYANTILCSAFEISAGFISAFMVKKFKSESIFKLVIIIQVIIYAFFFMVPSSVKEIQGYTMYFFVVCLLIAKLSNDLLNQMIYFLLPQIFTEKHIGVYLILSRGLARIFLILMPTVNFFMKSLGFHPFVLYGVIFAIFLFLMKFTQRKNSEPLDNFMKEINSPFIQRLSIVSASHSVLASGTFKEILNKFHLDSLPLNVLRKKKESPFSAKNQRNDISSPLISESKIPKSALYHYELKEINY